MSCDYKIRILYSISTSPEVYVVSPGLQCRANGRPIPHMYSKKNLCLYLPRSGEWEPDLFIADTIVPWTSLWLYHYEVWHATGSWLGGGQHPDDEHTDSPS